MQQKLMNVLANFLGYADFEEFGLSQVTGVDLGGRGILINDYSGTVTEGQQFTPAQMYSEQDMGTGASTDETSDAEGMSTSVEGNE